MKTNNNKSKFTNIQNLSSYTPSNSTVFESLNINSKTHQKNNNSPCQNSLELPQISKSNKKPTGKHKKLKFDYQFPQLDASRNQYYYWFKQGQESGQVQANLRYQAQECQNDEQVNQNINIQRIQDLKNEAKEIRYYDGVLQYQQPFHPPFYEHSSESIKFPKFKKIKWNKNKIVFKQEMEDLQYYLQDNHQNNQS